MPTEARLDTRFAALPRLIRAATNPNVSGADVREFMDELLQADAALFEGALEFLSREGHGFVLLRQVGGPLEYPRTWTRWPLRRLFAVRRAALITNPAGGQRGLAIPFSAGNERYVVIAPLRTNTFDPVQQTLLDTLQSVTFSPALSSNVTERVPRFVWLGNHAALAARITALLKERGWPMLSAPTFGHALLMLEQDRADVALLDSAALDGELAALRALRHAAKIGDAPIIYFTDGEAGSELRTLVDRVLAQNPDGAELLRALKSSVALVSRMRAQALHASVRKMEKQLRACGDFAELAETCAASALSLGADAVSVMLADQQGGVHASHLPLHAPLENHWPTPFMTGEAITSTRVIPEFFDTAFDEPEYAQRVRDLSPISAAALPIARGPQIVGSLLALSMGQPMFRPEFDALGELCECTASVALTLREPLQRSGPWQRAVFGDAVVEAFAGQKARASVCAHAGHGTAAIVMLERENDRRAAAIAECLLFESQADLREVLAYCKEDSRGVLIAVMDGSDRLRFACEGLPVPLRIPVSGPVPATRVAETCEAGVIHLDADSVTLLYSTEFAGQVDTAELVGVVQRSLRTSRATLARSLPRLGDRAQRLAFVAITMLSSDVGSPRQPTLL